jgi:hypothetical protein
MNPDLITELTKAIVSVVLILISAYLIPWLKNYIGDDKYQTILDFAEITVRAAEKIYTVDEWAQKKAYVVNMVSRKANELGIEIDEKEINAIVEGAVQAVKG